ncbi:MAG: hypothetical protein HUU57_14780 [Bdellovibrio sp.]|nr:hypothetical protein [Bdellovibrio sp.]
MNTSLMIMVASLLLGSFAQATSSVQCRGVDGHNEQVAVQARDLVSENGAIKSGSLRVVTLKLFGRRELCKDAVTYGDKNSQFYVACHDGDSVYTLALKLKETNKYIGTFCGNGPQTEVAGLRFTDEECIALSCSTTGL